MVGRIRLSRRSKYRSRKTEIDGRRFDSKREADRYLCLRAMERAGEITDLTCQVEFRLEVNGVLVCKYRADFVYLEGGGAVVEDVKGYRTRGYLLKKKLMRAIHNIDVREV